jgi:hypothetical protein
VTSFSSSTKLEKVSQNAMEGCGLHQPEDSQPSVLGGLIMGPNPELFCSHRRYVREGGARAYRTRQGRKIAQVFSVGDFGLFLSESDWDFFTGPARHKHPDWSPEIRKAWTRWQWPLAMIGGNHEPWHRLTQASGI